jgi:hypothetical protein
MSVSENIFNFNWNDVPDHLKRDVVTSHQMVADWALCHALTDDNGNVASHEVHDINDIGFFPDIDVEHDVSHQEEHGGGYIDSIIRTRVHGNDDLRRAVKRLVSIVSADAADCDMDECFPGCTEALREVEKWLDTEREG